MLLLTPSVSGLFKWRQFEPEVILLAVGWYLRFLAKALGRQNHPVPRVINTDGHAAYPPAVARLKAQGALAEDCRHRPVPYLNNVLEQDHRAIPASDQRQSAFPLLLGSLANEEPAMKRYK
jgi:transposase-like protein